MAYSVINGAIGKNPIIENMNQSLIFHSEDHISKQMEKIVLGQRKIVYSQLSFTFEKTRKEISEQLKRMKK